MLRQLLADAPPDQVSLGWILDRLHERSFGVVILILALVALVPGLAIPAALLMLVPAVQMILARHHPVVPRVLARRRFPTRRLAACIHRLVPVLERLERLIRPRWMTRTVANHRLVGALLLLLALSMLGPIPFSHIPPALAIILVAVAYMEEDGVALGAAALFGVGVSFSITAATAWAAVEGMELLGRMG